jgi:transglutaminase-like putative cysteine protease
MTLAAAAACAATSLVVYPLFVDWRWLAIAAGAVIAAAVAGSVTRLRAIPVPACLAGSVAGLLLYLNLAFEARHSLLLAIPTPASLAGLRALAGTGLSEANRYAAPAPDLPGLLLLTAAGVGITAVFADLIAVRLRAPALAGLPLLVLFTVPAMMNAPYSRLGSVLVCCLPMLGYLAMLSADGRERIRGWGRLIPLSRTGTGSARPAADTGAVRWVGGSGPRPEIRAAAAARVGGRGGGWRAGLASIVLALCAPMLVPGLSHLFSAGPGTGAIAAAFTKPDENHPKVLFTYTTTAPASLESNDAQYFRQSVFDTLSDTGWQVRDYAAGATRISSIPPPPGLSGQSSSQRVKTTVTVSRDFAGPGPEPAFLPLPYPATAIAAPGTWLADSDLMVYSTRDSIAGKTYSVQSLAVDPSPAQLESVPGLTDTADLAPDLELPSSYETTALRNMAQQHADGQGTEFGEVNALANWLSGPQFSYNLAPVPFDDAAGLLSFLTKTRSGFCVQYAYAMTVLTRLLGLPARLVTGYTAGTRLANGSHVVKSTDAHAWTEVYFPTLGWIRFEPTPGSGGTADPPNYMAPSTVPPVAAGTVNPVTSEPAGPAVSQPGSSANRSHSSSDPPSLGGAADHSPAGSPGPPWAVLALAVVVASVMALMTPAAARVALRRRRWSRATDDASRAHAAWRDFRDDLADYGIGARASEPPRKLAGRIGAGMPEPASAAIRRLAQAEERASYAGRPSGSQYLRHDSATARRSLAARAGRGARWRARILPASVMSRRPNKWLCLRHPRVTGRGH